jgi:hypothetical protein
MPSSGTGQLCCFDLECSQSTTWTVAASGQYYDDCDDDMPTRIQDPPRCIVEIGLDLPTCLFRGIWPDTGMASGS